METDPRRTDPDGPPPIGDLCDPKKGGDGMHEDALENGPSALYGLRGMTSADLIEV